MNEIVKYHNDFNKIKLPSFTEQEQNLLFLIFAKIKEKGIGNTIMLYSEDLKINESISNSREYLTEIIDNLKNKFFKADFRQIIETKTTITERIVNLFETMEIHYTKRNPDDGYDTSKLFERIDLALNPTFSYLVNQLTTNFTRFELAEFISLSGKYTKTLYRLLKQYRTTGIAKFEWEEFKRIMDIPENYQMCDIDKRILKPAIKELTKELNLFDYLCRMPFTNLAYEKEKAKTKRGRGGKVIGITFTFKPENIKLQEIENAENINQALENLINQKWIYQDELLQVISIDNLEVTCNVLERDEYENLVTKKTTTITFKNQKELIEEIAKRIC